MSWSYAYVTYSHLTGCAKSLLTASFSRCHPALRYSAGAALPKLRSELSKQLEEIEAAGTFKHERVITSKQSNLIYVKGRDDPVLNFCANNYLGLSVSTVNCMKCI